MAVSHWQCFGYGFGESVNSLVERAPVILAGAGVVAGIGYLVSGTAAAMLAAKVTGCLLSAVYGLGHPDVVGGIDTSAKRIIRYAGNVAAIISGPLLIFSLWDGVPGVRTCC